MARGRRSAGDSRGAFLLREIAIDTSIAIVGSDTAAFLSPAYPRESKIKFEATARGRAERSVPGYLIFIMGLIKII
jgi:hypothetical protein